MVAFIRFSILAGLLAGTTQAGQAIPPFKQRRQYASSGEIPSIRPSTPTAASISSILRPSAPGPATGSSSSSPSANGSKLSPSNPSSAALFSYKPATSTFSTYGGLTTTAPNATCAGATLNVLGASLDWWYAQAYTYVASTFVVQYDSDGSATGWVLEPATTTFDVTSAVQAPTCATTSALNTGASQTQLQQVCATTPPPLAASTTVITKTAYSIITATSGTGAVPNVVITPPPAAITIPSSGGNFSAGTPFVFFSRYEIMTKQATTYGNGSVGCAETTNIYNMSSPFSFEYTGEDVNGSIEVNAGVTGDVNPAFLGIVNVTNAIAGSWVAAPTVAVIVSKVVAVSQSVLATPSATLPAYFSTLASSPTGATSIFITESPMVESSASYLLLPSSVPSKAADTTPAGSGPGSPASAQSAPAQSTPANNPPQSVYTGTPTNALEVLSQAATTYASNALAVLSQAEQTYPSNPTASAIVSGISGQPGGAAAANPPAITLGGSILTANAATQYNVGGSILTPGGEVVWSGSTISMAPGATAIVINGQTTPLAAAAVTGAAPPAITLGGSIVTANAATQYNVGGSILTPGGQVVWSGSTISMAPGATAVVVNGQTTPLAAAAATITGAPALTVNGQAIPRQGGSYIVSGQTLTPGGAITFTGSNGVVETMSLNSAGNQLFSVQNGITGSTSLAGAAATGAPIITLAGQSFLPVNNGATYVIGGKTLTPGGIITMTTNGQAYVLFLAPGATMLQVEMENSASVVTATSYETLSPVPMKTGTVTTPSSTAASPTATTTAASTSAKTGAGVRVAASADSTGSAATIALAFGTLLMVILL